MKTRTTIRFSKSDKVCVSSYEELVEITDDDGIKANELGAMLTCIKGSSNVNVFFISPHGFEYQVRASKIVRDGSLVKVELRFEKYRDSDTE